MFERLEARVRAAAQRRAAERAEALAGELGPALPSGVRAEGGEGGLILSGRGLKRRFALDPRLLWLLAGLR